MTAYCIAVVDDDDGVRTSIVCLLRAEGHNVEDFQNPIDFLHAVDRHRPYDCVLLDERMTPLNGLATFRALREKNCLCPALMVTGVATADLTMNAVEAGFSYLLQKPIAAAELVERVERYCAENRRALTDQQRKAVEKTILDALSEREVQVLRMLSSGMLNKQIASELGVGLRTVETYRNRVMSKIGATCLADAVAFAISVGLRSPGVSSQAG